MDSGSRTARRFISITGISDQQITGTLIVPQSLEHLYQPHCFLLRKHEQHPKCKLVTYPVQAISLGVRFLF